MLLSNPATYDRRPLSEAHALSVAGYSVTILAWDREGATKADSSYGDGMTVKRMRLRAGRGTPYLTAPKLFLFYAWCLAHLVAMRTDVIHCHDVDTLIAGFAAKALKLGRPRLVYDMHDLPEAFLRFFPLASMFQSMFLSGVRRGAELVVVASEGYVPYLRARGFEEGQLAVVLNAPPLAEGSEPGQHVGQVNVLYYGGLEEERGVRLIVQALRDMEGVDVTLAGRGTLEPWVREVARTSKNVRFLGWLGTAALEKEIARADLMPSIYAPRSANILLSTPNKLLKSFSMSIPALVAEGTHQADIVRRYACGFVVEWGNEPELKKVVAEMSGTGGLKERLKRNAYEAFTKDLNWEKMQSRLVAGYERALGQGHGVEPAPDPPRKT